MVGVIYIGAIITNVTQQNISLIYIQIIFRVRLETMNQPYTHETKSVNTYNESG